MSQNQIPNNEPAIAENASRIAPLIDHTLLKAEAPHDQVAKLCAEARQHGFATVCISPYMVSFAAEHLKGSSVGVDTVAGFPFGFVTTAEKAFETECAVKNGATEVDMVINVAALKEGRHNFVRDDIVAVVKAAQGRTIKVILETCYLTDEQKVSACHICVEAGASFVKTSTGMAGGATVEDIRLMRKTTGPSFGVKASGGIRTLVDALRMVEAGATRIGTSSGVAIVTGAA